MVSRIASFAAVVCCAVPAWADGYLWLAGEFNTPYQIYRLNMQTGKIDLTVPLSEHHPDADVFNNLAYDGKNLYIGSDDDGFFAKADPITAQVESIGQYNGVGNDMGWEDGAFNKSTGTLWRAGSGTILENDTDGNVVNIFTGGPHYVGMEWHQGTLYSTDFNSFGEVVFNGNSVSYQPIFLSGIAADQAFYGISEDQSTGKLYLATHGSLLGNFQGYVYEVDVANKSATVAFDLNAAGYPPKGNGAWINPDAMGWVPIPAPTAASLLALAAAVSSLRRR
jgi:hypothetical protein